MSGKIVVRITDHLDMTQLLTVVAILHKVNQYIFNSNLETETTLQRIKKVSNGQELIQSKIKIMSVKPKS